MNKILKRLLTGVLTLATVFTALPTTAVHAAETQYWTESEERVGIVEKVMNDGSIGSTFNEGHMTVEGEDAYCIDINTGFKNGYKTRSDASTRMTAYQIEDVALSLEYVKQYTKSHTGLSSQHAYLLRQLVVWQRLSVHLGWSCDNVRASYDEISKSVQDEVFAGAKAFVRENKGRYDCYGYIYTGEGQDLGQFFAELAVGNGKIQKSSSNTTVTNGNDCYSLSGATYGVYSDKGCTKSVATLTTNANGNTDTVELRAATYYVKETKAPKGFQLDKNVYTIIDMMYYDEEGVYFLTAKGKAFYDQLMEQQYVAISATKDKIAVSLRGKIKNIGKKNLDIMFEKNPYMKKIYPGDTKDAIEVFRLYEAQGEYFDISNPSNIVRDTITIGKTEAVQTGYFIGKECIGCKLCCSVCPQKCIDISSVPVTINQNHCLHCGRCAEICPKQCIEKRGSL
ncbi:Pyruvic-ferredoxin oxidoreductase subunit delta [Blautia obeum]|uniref:Pyruvic-ferredoxin oxidoreductase subunit delta n=2 Tax=Blautia obeum TaxID=40520 RepID=A0A174T4W8_9FIRM|nr:Pyruvic-ferredoxin oxidoreductase subunit delta [Blautia obeum]